MKMRNILVAIVVLPVLLFCAEKEKDSSSNIIRNYGVWLDETASTYNIYVDPSVPVDFRNIIQSVCDDLEPLSVIGEHFSLNYTGLESSQNSYDNICQINYSDYGFEFIAKACNEYSPEAYSPNGLYFGVETKFDVLINDNYIYTTGQFGTPNVYDRASVLRHEFGHGVAGLAHNVYSPMMKSDSTYNKSNPERVVTATDITNYHALYNPAEITNPSEIAGGYYEVLLVNGIEINLEATKPAVVNTDYADLDFYLFNEDYTYDVALPQNVVIDRYIEYQSSKYSFAWILDTTKVTNKTYKIISTYSGFDPDPDYIASYPHDERNIRFSELTFDSPQENQRYSVSTPLDFKVFGKSALSNVAIGDIANIATVTYKLEEDDLFDTDIFETETNSATNFELTADLTTYDIDAVDYLVTVTVKDGSNNVLSTIEKMPIKLYIPLNIEAPSPGGIYNVRSRTKGAVTDTLAIKVSVPEVYGSHPNINIKIDGTYVSQGDITYDSTEDVWVYNWDLSATNPTELGTRYNIVAEIDGDPTSYSASGIYLVEAIFNEDFETITDLVAAGWSLYTWHTPFSVVNSGWIVGNKVNENNNGVALSVTIPSATYIGYRMWTPIISLPNVTSGTLIKLKYRFYFNKSNSSSLYSLLKFAVTNTSGTAISTWSTLPGVDESWVDMEYDLTAYAGQSIKLQWFNNYLTGPALPSTEYDVDDIIIYQTIDTSSPAIDFIAGNSAELDEDMNLNIGFNDNSGIGSVTADYSIEGDSNTITLYPVKGSYNYTGSIPARDHICEGSISFKIKDSVGNETVSAGHSISWGTGSILTAPENVLITQPTSTTISITWDIVDGATGYKVYSSTDPYGTFTEDSTGTFTESRKWEKTVDGYRYFYYVVATNLTKFDTSAIKEEELEIAKVVGQKE